MDIDVLGILTTALRRLYFLPDECRECTSLDTNLVIHAVLPHVLPVPLIPYVLETTDAQLQNLSTRPVLGEGI